MATMIASFAATPTRGAKIVVMGDAARWSPSSRGRIRWRTASSSRAATARRWCGSPTPARYTPFTDARDPRLMAFRLLVREFTRGIGQRASPSPNFTDGLRCQEVMDAVRASSAFRQAPVRLR